MSLLTNPNSSKSHWIDNNLTGYKWCFICSSCEYVDGFPFNDRLPQCPCCKATMDLNYFEINQPKESEHNPNAE